MKNLIVVLSIVLFASCSKKESLIKDPNNYRCVYSTETKMKYTEYKDTATLIISNPPYSDTQYIYTEIIYDHMNVTRKYIDSMVALNTNHTVTHNNKDVKGGLYYEEITRTAKCGVLK